MICKKRMMSTITKKKKSFKIKLKKINTWMENKINLHKNNQ